MAPGFIINHRGAYGLDQRATGSHGAEPEVYTKNKTILGDVSHGMNDVFANVCKKFSWGRFPFPAARGFTLIVLVQKDHVDIGAEIQLAAAEFSHAQNDKTVLRLLVRQEKRTVILFRFDPTKSIRSLQGSFGQGAKLADRFFQGDRRLKISRADAQVLTLFVAPQRGAQILKGLRFCCCRVQLP